MSKPVQITQSVYTRNILHLFPSAIETKTNHHIPCVVLLGCSWRGSPPAWHSIKVKYYDLFFSILVHWRIQVTIFNDHLSSSSSSTSSSTPPIPFFRELLSFERQDAYQMSKAITKKHAPPICRLVLEYIKCAIFLCMLSSNDVSG